MFYWCSCFVVYRAEKSSIAGHQQKVQYVLHAGVQHGMLVAGMLVVVVCRSPTWEAGVLVNQHMLSFRCWHSSKTTTKLTYVLKVAEVCLKSPLWWLVFHYVTFSCALVPWLWFKSLSAIIESAYFMLLTAMTYLLVCILSEISEWQLDFDIGVLKWIGLQNVR